MKMNKLITLVIVTGMIACLVDMLEPAQGYGTLLINAIEKIPSGYVGQVIVVIGITATTSLIGLWLTYLIRYKESGKPANL